MKAAERSAASERVFLVARYLIREMMVQQYSFELREVKLEVVIRDATVGAWSEAERATHRSAPLSSLPSCYLSRQPPILILSSNKA